jgi:hypothetical protein
MKSGRREFLGIALALGVLPIAARGAAGKPMKIGIVGSGRVGGTLGGVWVRPDTR